jgi:GTP:adenosylcobinamide-phosphate guanylyltransferase
VSVTALVLGGGRADDAVAAHCGVPVKALAPVGGEPMAAHVLRALRAGGAARIVYIGPLTPSLEPLVDVHLEAKGTLLENLQAGLEGCAGASRVLVSTADIPLLSADAVRDVLTRDPGVGLVYPIVSMAASERRFPGGKRTSARVKEGRFTGGNLFLLEPRLVGAFLPRLRYILENRKNVVKLALMFGVGALVKLALGQLAIAELEGTASRILGVPAQALVTDYPEIGFDVDKVEDLALVSRLVHSEPA